MSIWQLTGWIVLVGVGAIIVLAGWLIARSTQTRKRLSKEQLLAARQVAERAVLGQVPLEQAARESQEETKQATTQAATQAAESATLDMAMLEQATLEQAISEWAAAEQAEADRLQLRRASEEQWEAEQLEGRMRAVEEAIAEWLEAEREESHQMVATVSGQPPRKARTRTEAIHEQVRLTNEKVMREVADLDFIKNRIEAGVDFLPLEFKQTIDEWKRGQVLRHSTFEDLKLKFRYKAYSIEDGYELLYLYNDWLAQQRQKLRVFIRLLGSKVDNTESIQSAIERMERLEHEKYLEMNVDAIFILRDIRAILEKLISMETLLKQFEEVCRKRSEQIIAPSWEAKGSL